MKLTIEIGSIIKGLEAGLNTAKNKLKSFASGIKSTLGGAFGSIGAGLSIAGFAAFTKKAIDYADGIAGKAKQTKTTAEEFQKIAYAIEQSGGSADAAVPAFKKMNSVIYEAGQGNEKARKTLAALGLSMDDLQGKTPEQKFAAIVAALNNITDETTQAALATKIFGGAGKELIPMLGDYEALKTEIESLGGVISNEAVEAADKFNDSMAQIGVTLQAALLDSGLVEYLGKVVEGFSAVISIQNKLGKKTGVGAPGSAGYRGGVKGLFSDFVDESDNLSFDSPLAWGGLALAGKGLKALGVGEQDVEEQIRNELTDEQKKQLEVNKKAFDETGKTTAQRKEEQKAKVEENKHALEKERQEKQLQKEREKQTEIEKKQTASIAEVVADMNEKLKIQKLINAGKEKEAAIEQALSDAQKRGGRTLTDVEKKSITAAAAALFDAEQKPQKEAGPLGNIARIETSDAVKRIGGIIGEGGSGRSADTKPTTLLEKMSKTLESIDDKTQRSYNTNKMVFP